MHLSLLEETVIEMPNTDTCSSAISTHATNISDI